MNPQRHYWPQLVLIFLLNNYRRTAFFIFPKKGIPSQGKSLTRPCAPLPFPLPTLVIKQARTLALSVEFASENLTPLMTCASLVGRSITVDGQRCAQETPPVRGGLFVGQVSYSRRPAGVSPTHRSRETPAVRTDAVVLPSIFREIGCVLRRVFFSLSLSGQSS